MQTRSASLRPAFARVPTRAPSLLSAALLASVGLTLSTLSSPGWAQATAADPVTLPAVSVTASRDDASQTDTVSAGALGSRKQVDTPYSTHVVSSEEGQDLLATNANDLFQFDPAVSVTSDNAISENANFSVRGLQIDTLNGIKVDGQSFPSWDTELSLEPFEQVQLLKGASGFMYGFGTPGGIVNYVLKRPTDEPYRSISVGYESAGVFNEKVDLGGRFGNDDRFGFRLNLVNEDGNTAEANGHLRRQVASLALDFRITPELTWTADAFYQKRKTTGTLFGMMFGSGVDIPDASLVTHELTQPQNYYQTDMASFGTGLDYRLSENWHASLKYRFAKENRTNSDSLLYVYDNAGDYDNTLYAAMTRYFYQSVDAMVEGKFNTGSIKHDVVLGAGYQSQSSEYDNSGKYETRVAGKDVTFRAGINNLFNRRYWTTAWGYYVSPSATRTTVASATMQF